MNDPAGIELFSWPLCWAGVLGAFLLDLTRWAARLIRNRLPQRWGHHLAASFILLVAGGGTAGLFGGYLTAAWMAAAIGAGAPAVLRTLATLGPRIVERLAGKREGRAESMPELTDYYQQRHEVKPASECAELEPALEPEPKPEWDLPVDEHDSDTTTVTYPGFWPERDFEWATPERSESESWLEGFSW